MILRSDELRKGLSGVPVGAHLGPEGYSSQMSERVYAALAERADLVLGAGHSVIVDAVHASAGDRQAIERVATAASAPFIGLWLEAPEPVLIARAEKRRNDASDADANVVRMQRARDTGHIGWLRVDASRSAAFVLSFVLDHIHNTLPEARLLLPTFVQRP